MFFNANRNSKREKTNEAAVTGNSKEGWRKISRLQPTEFAVITWKRSPGSIGLCFYYKQLSLIGCTTALWCCTCLEAQNSLHASVTGKKKNSKIFRFYMGMGDKILPQNYSGNTLRPLEIEVIWRVYSHLQQPGDNLKNENLKKRC